MKQGYSHISFLLDRSGSMQSVLGATIEGFNGFLDQQQKGPGTATATLVQFDNVPGMGHGSEGAEPGYHVLYRMTALSAVPKLTTANYRPRGGTPLVDSIARLIDETGADLSNLPEDQRPEQVFFVIVTDGYENASTHAVMSRNELLPGEAKPVVNEMIKLQSETYGWKFIFLGANQDAIRVAQGLNIPTAAAVTYAATPKGTRAAYAVASAGMARAREMNVSVYFTDDEREAAMGKLP